MNEPVELVTKAKVGDCFSHRGERYRVESACSENDGYWMCITHKQAFLNQMQKDSHISTYNGEVRHKLVWFCHSHGPETP